jgi:hypothetical protein
MAGVRGKLRCGGASSSSPRSRSRLPRLGNACMSRGRAAPTTELQVVIIAKIRATCSNSGRTGDRAPPARQIRKGLKRFGEGVGHRAQQ